MALMSGLFNKKDADQQVIEVLLRELNRRSKMSKYFRDTNGQLYRATEYDVVTPEELNEHVEKLTDELSGAAALSVDGPVNVLVTAVQVETEEAVADPVQSEEPAPAAPAEDPAISEPAAEATEAPAAPEQPADEGVQPPAAPEEPTLVQSVVSEVPADPAKADPINLQ